MPIGRALLWIGLSLALVLAAAAAVRAYSRMVKNWRMADPSYHLFAIVQTGQEKEALRTACLAEWLELASDHPTNLYAFSCAAARRRLLEQPLIKEATVKTFLPGIVYVDYAVRRPVAYLVDYSNTAIDAEGVLIPCAPFFTPKKIPQIYLGLPAMDRVWGRRISPSSLQLVREVQALLADDCAVKTIDLSHAQASSYGQRQIVIRVEEQGLPVILRVSPAHYRESLKHYQQLREGLHAQVGKVKEVVVDLRIPKLAYLKNIELEEG